MLESDMTGSGESVSVSPVGTAPSPAPANTLVPRSTLEGRSQDTAAPRPAAATPSKIALENMKAGNPESEWGVAGDGSANIQGFATQISTDVGQTVNFKIATDSTHYRIDIYRMGYYGGAGARKVASIDKMLSTAQVQPHPNVDYSTGLIDCANWVVSANWAVPDDAVSGVYFAKLVREDGTAGESIIPFVVRDDNSTSDIVFQTSDTTWQAYNEWGGASLYYGNVPTDPNDMIAYLPPNCSCGMTAIGRATAVSYNRPFVTNTSNKGGTHDFIFGAEYPAIRWLEQNGYDVSYISGVDTARAGSKLLDHKAFLSVGHDEYWSGEQRANVEAARDAGVNLAFWSGNEVYWKVRWESGADGTPYRTMVCYKETWANADTDPSSTATGTFRDPRFKDPGQKPENSLTGTMFQVDSYRQDAITVPYDYSQLRFWRNTDIATLQPGETGSLVKNLLGYEWDSDVDNGFRPAGLVNLSLSNVSVDTYLLDYGNTVGPADASHSLIMYRAASGALVFGAGTVFWSWGLDSHHGGAATPIDPNVRQAMVNMFADMGIQPTTLDASLVLATQSTDRDKPISTITSPTAGATYSEGQRLVITGTAQDAGGRIAGIEVSTDNGQTWHKATGTNTWSYDWNVQATGTYTIRSRATDDSLNIEMPSTGKEISVSLPSTSSLWTYASVPDTIMNYTDRRGIEIGTKFQSTTSGTVMGLRLYKGDLNASQHTIDLWTANGTLLASNVSVGETREGWQQISFNTPVHINAGTTYIASYHTTGFYSFSSNYFTSTYTKGPLSVAPGGGVFTYSAGAGAFPTSSFNNSNYWVDVVFAKDANLPPTAVDDTGLTATLNTVLVIPVSTLLANDTDPNGDTLAITAVGGALHGTVALDAAAGNVLFTPTNGYTGPASFNYTVSDGSDGTDSGDVALTVTGTAPEPAQTLFAPDATPAVLNASDTSSVELGMKFVASSNGTVSGIRFYKGTQNTGTHTGTLWTTSGTKLGTTTFTNETASGWQTATFSTPLSITAGTTYVVSYHTSGNYSLNTNYFTSTVTSGKLTAPSSAASGGNGLYAYGSGSLFPTNTYNSANYWVDVLYNPNAVGSNQVPVAVNDNDYTTNQNTVLTINASSLLANDTDADGDPLSITGVSGASNGTVAFNSQSNVVTFTPANGYTGTAGFSYSISDGRGGTASAGVNLSVNEPSTAVGLFTPSEGPTATTGTDTNSVELGVKFVASSGGTISGLRYYKSANDTGAHKGSLWSSTGTLLASATFTNESASGWQTVAFASPVTIAAGTTYVASYHSNGRYVATGNYFNTAHTSGSLTAPAGANGVYAYGTNSLFPTSSYGASNYWVDVLYNQGAAASNQAPVAVNDPGYSTMQNTALQIAGSALLVNDTDPDNDPLTITGVSGATHGTVAFNSQTNTVTFTPTAGYTGSAGFSYAISDGQGHAASADVSLTVTPPSSSESIFSSSATPAVAVVNDPSPVELGLKFDADVAGTITGIRFYKGEGNIGSHQAHLWTTTGTLLGTATFTNETASGWQTAYFADPISIQAETDYVASYHSNGNYSATGNGLGSSIVNGHLEALSSALSGGNGVYGYGASGTFPTSSYNATNYFVDVVFKPQIAAA